MSQHSDDAVVENRRKVLKGIALATGAAVTTAVVAGVVKAPKSASGSGVAVGNTHKNEILYQDSPAWDAYYKSTL